MRHLIRLSLIAMIFIMIAVNIQANSDFQFVSNDINSSLSNLKNSKNIRILNSENKHYSGRFINYDSSKLTLRSRKNFRDIPLTEIYQMYYRKNSSLAIVIIPSTIGMGIGFAIGKYFEHFSIFGPPQHNHEAPYIGAGIGLAIGALVGVVIRTVTSKWILFYEQPDDLTESSTHQLHFKFVPDKNGGAKLALSINF